MLEIEKITKKYNRTAVVNEVSFTLKPGDILGYLGPNGAGKTTTMKMLTGILEPTTGRILFNGKDIYAGDNLIRYKKNIGYIPEQSHLYMHLSAYEYLQMIGRLRFLPEEPTETRTQGLMEQFKLVNDMHFPMTTYSKGMKQKGLIAAALLHNPDVLILDEPLSGLDVFTTLVFKNLIANLAAAGKMIIYSSHILEIIEKICTRVIIIDRGTIVAHDAVERLRNLMNLPSLESIFKELVHREDPEAAAHNLLDIIVTGHTG